jgi:hypothetical protein
MLAQQRSVTQLIELVNQQHQQAQAILAEINRKQQVDALAEPGHAVAVRWAQGTWHGALCARGIAAVDASQVLLWDACTRALLSSCHHPAICLQQYWRRRRGS